MIQQKYFANNVTAANTRYLQVFSTIKDALQNWIKLKKKYMNATCTNTFSNSFIVQRHCTIHIWKALLTLTPYWNQHFIDYLLVSISCCNVGSPCALSWNVLLSVSSTAFVFHSLSLFTHQRSMTSVSAQAFEVLSFMLSLCSITAISPLILSQCGVSVCGCESVHG